MRDKNSATVTHARPLSGGSGGILWGFLGMTAFSLTVPLTRSAVDALDPLFIGAGRAVIAAALAAIVLLAARQRLPQGRQWWRLALVAAGVVVGFPLLTSYALTQTPASHGAVVIALLPAATAVAAALRTGERPGLAFWIAASAGALAGIGFAAMQGDGGIDAHWADLLLFGAVLAAAIGYAEGGLLSRELGSWQTISWALLLAAPLMIVLTGVSLLRQGTPSGSAWDWAAFAYLAAVSMFLGFFAWYRGLALGPMTRVSQIQLLQPVLSIGWAALLLSEPLSWATGAGAMAVIVCAAMAVRIRARAPQRRREPRRSRGRW